MNLAEMLKDLDRRDEDVAFYSRKLDQARLDRSKAEADVIRVMLDAGVDRVRTLDFDYVLHGGNSVLRHGVPLFATDVEVAPDPDPTSAIDERLPDAPALGDDDSELLASFFPADSIPIPDDFPYRHAPPAKAVP